MPRYSSTRLATALILAPFVAFSVPAWAENRIFYIDYENGNDASNGLSPQTAWKHGPWDSAGTGAAKKLAIKPGDTFRFKGGVRYRGSMSPRGVGTKEAPIIFDGSSWGNMRAIMDGGTALGGVRPCKSASDCLGSPHWANLYRADLPSSAIWTDWLFINDQPFQMGQYPDLSEDDSDDPSKFLVVPHTELARLKAGSIKHPLPKDLHLGTPLLGLWIQGNQIAYTTDVKVSTTGAEFAGASWVNGSLNPYASGDNKFTILNAPAMVNRPGLFAVSPENGVAIFWPHPSNSKSYKATIGSGRTSFLVNSLGHGIIHGFSFANFTAKPKQYSSGMAVYSNSGVDSLRISSNSFRGFMNIGSGRGALHIVRATNLKIQDNFFENLPATTAIAVDQSSGPAVIKCNVIRNIGKTGIRLGSVVGGQVLGNHLSGVRGVHGNAISAYNDNRDTVIAGNVVTNSHRPLTAHGPKYGPQFDHGTPSLLVQDNVLISTSESAGGFVSYGFLDNLTIRNNFLAAPKAAIRLRGSETNVSISGNTLVGSVVDSAKNFNPQANTSHAVDGNGSLLVEQKNSASPPAKYCD